MLFKHLAKAKSSLEEDRDKLKKREQVVSSVQAKLDKATTELHEEKVSQLE